MTRDDEVVGRAYDNRLMRRLLGYLRPYRGQVALAGIVVIGDALVQLVYPWLTKEAIDNGIRHKDLAFLDRVAIVYLAILGVGFALGYLQNQIMQRVGQHVMLDLRTALFAKLQRLPVSYYDRNPIGRLMTRVTNDVDVLNELVTAGVGALFGDLFGLVGVVIAMWRLNAELLVVTFSVLPLIAIATILFRTRMRASFRDVRTRLARLNTFLNENLSGMSTVQLLNREGRNYEQFREVNAGHRDANLTAVFYNAVFFPLLELFGALAVSLIVWYGGRQVMWTGITLGTLVAFIQYTQRFFRPISDLSEKYSIMQQAMASAERIFDLLDTEEDPALARPAGAATPLAAAHPAPHVPGAAGNGVAGPAHASAASAAPAAHASATPAVSAAHASAASAATAATASRADAAARGRVEFDHVSFAYVGDHRVIDDVSFRLEPGERVALVGATGSGKSTLANLLLRFYEPQGGVIRLDGRPLAEWDVRALRREIGLVLQDAFLFSGTIESNLRLGDPTLTHEAIERAAREVHAHEFVSRLPGGYDAVVRERGATFSAGQRQLLTFARTLARDPRLLVLDEATSSVDTHTEQLIQDALRRLMRGRTCLVIAHRLSTIQDVDRIVVLHHGRVRESGTHTELLARGGIYTRLYQLQFLDPQGRRPERVAEELSMAESEPGSAVDSPLNLT